MRPDFSSGMPARCPSSLACEIDVWRRSTREVRDLLAEIAARGARSRGAFNGNSSRVCTRAINRRTV
jgi:hypothetical protein